ncbi:MAG: methylmalonyl Co-A mutase-associated GTPase MeaB [Pseudomonadota bacterium]
MAKTITLMESTRDDHRSIADQLLTKLLPFTGKSLRIGLSGVPGVGKSTLIENLGLWLIKQGHKVAVLAIDPSSNVSGGSILGDKTRMEILSNHPSAFIRPSPSSGNLGGVAEKTRECILVCEAAGFDIVIVETVGVGQSETTVAGMTDMFVLMQLPNAGDDLQAIKKGIMEIADLILINKADLDDQAALQAESFISSALHLFRGRNSSASDGAQWQPKVLRVSALNGQGVEALWSEVSHFKQTQEGNGQWQNRRQAQSRMWMQELIQSGLKRYFHQNPQVALLLPQLEQEVLSGKIAASTAARQLLALWS